MARSWLKRNWSARRPHRRDNRDRTFPAAAVIEPLDARVMLSVTALFAAGTLRITGDDQDNAITLSRTVGGALLVNDGAVVIQGDPTASVTSATTILIVGAGGNDAITLDQTNGRLPGAGIF